MSQRFRSYYADFMTLLPEDRNKSSKQYDTEIQEIFSKQRAENHLSRPEKSQAFYDAQQAKQNAKNEERRNLVMKSKMESKAKRQNQQEENVTMDFGVVDTDTLRQEKINKIFNDQSKSKLSKTKDELNKAKDIQSMKTKAEDGDLSALKKLKEFETEAALQRIQGQKVHDDVSRLQKSIKNQEQMKKKRTKEYDHKQQIKEVQTLVAAGTKYQDAKKSIFSDKKQHPKK
eukprot:EST47622.1 Surfeit locus protein 6 family protein [Spironucleus salmonicida]